MSSCPKLRIEGFTDAWEQRKLGDCLSMITYGFTNPMSDTNNGPWKITAKDIVNGKIDYAFARHTSKKEYDGLTDKSKPLVDDLLLTKDGTLGRTAIVDNENICINQSVALLRFNETCSAHYTKILLDTPVFQKQMLDDAGGGTIKHIYITKIDKMLIPIPTKQEQDRLICFFYDLDNLITLHQRKSDALKNAKKYFLNNMFPSDGEKFPEIRFKGFTDAWEQRKVSDLFRVTRGYVLPATETDGVASAEKPYPVYSSQTKENGLLGYYQKYLYENAITWTTDGANAGTVNYRAGKFYCTNVCGVLLSNDGYANKMVAEALNAIAWKHVSRVGNPKLMNNVMSQIEICIPKSIEEQKLISEYLDQIDNLITLHQRKCDALKNAKKFFLQNMFV